MDPIHIIAAVFVVLAVIGYCACLIRFFWLGLVFTAGAVAYFSTIFPFTAQSLPFWGVPGIGIAIGFVVALWYRSGPPTPKSRRRGQKSKNRIVIDGTNVLFWVGETPQLETLRNVVTELISRSITPVVFLDASSRHHLKDKSLNTRGFARALGLPEKQVMVCPAGAEADEFILQFAQQEALPILSNDRFEDRSDLARNLKIVKGVMVDDQLLLDGL